MLKFSKFKPYFYGLKIFLKNEKYAISAIFIFNLIILLYAISNLSISYYEADIFFNKDNIVSLLANLSCKIFGHNDFALRIPFLIIHFINSFLIYKISKFILNRKIDRIISLALFMALPGVMSGAILVNMAVFIMFFTLSFIYFKELKKEKLMIFTLVLSIFISKAFILLYISLFLYSYFNKEQKLCFLNFALFLISFFVYDYNIDGKPKGYFLDTIGVFAAVFSPFVFLIFVYSIYRIAIKEKKTILWYIVFIPFVVSIFLSIRQKVELEIFLPYCVLSVPLMVKVFLHSFRIRLPYFRKIHKFFIITSVSFLVFNIFVTTFNQYLYIFFKDKPKKHFIYKYDVAKELAKELKKQGIEGVNSLDKKYLLRLKFYGIKDNSNFFLYENEKKFNCKEIVIKKYGIIIANFCVL